MQMGFDLGLSFLSNRIKLMDIYVAFFDNLDLLYFV